MRNVQDKKTVAQYSRWYKFYRKSFERIFFINFDNVFIFSKSQPFMDSLKFIIFGF